MPHMLVEAVQKGLLITFNLKARKVGSESIMVCVKQVDFNILPVFLTFSRIRENVRNI
jgi:hypothetical protein